MARIDWKVMSSWSLWFVAACIAAIPGYLGGLISPAFGFVVFFAVIAGCLYVAARLP